MLKALKNKQKGITLIALIITIIVLLILAGVTIAAINSNESAPNKAVEARTKNEQGAEFDAIKLAAVSSIADGDYTLHVNVDTLKRGLEGVVLAESINAINENNYPWIVTGNTGMKYKITQNGEVTAAEAVASVYFEETTANIGVGKSKKLPIITKGASGNLTEAYEVQFIPDKPSLVTIEDDGTITIANDNNIIGETVTISVIADGINGSNECVITVIAELKVGDYVVINSNQYNTIDEDRLAQLNNDINNANISGTTNSAFTRNNNLKWRVLELDDGGNPKKLISAAPAGTLRVSGSNGYNNAVYLLHNLCNSLYSCNIGTARNLIIEDIEKFYIKDENGKTIKDRYSNMRKNIFIGM